MADFRIRAGKHFLTDNVVGYALSATVGLVVPRLHRVSSGYDAANAPAQDFTGSLIGCAVGAATGVVVLHFYQKLPGTGISAVPGLSQNGYAYAYGGLQLARRWSPWPEWQPNAPALLRPSSPKSSLFFSPTMQLPFVLLTFALLSLSAAGPDAGPISASVPAQVVPAAATERIRALLADTLAKVSPLAQSQQSRMFYRRRAYVPAWSVAQQPSQSARAALALLARAEDFGLLPSLYHVGALQAVADSLTQPQAVVRQTAQLARYDVLLTDGLLTFAVHLRRGRLRAFTPSPLEKAGVPFAPAAWLARALAAPDFAQALLQCQPQQREYQQLQQALARWRRHPVGVDAAQRSRRARQMAVTLERWRWEAIPDADYVLVNLPAYQLEVVRHGRVLQTHRLVIGRPANPTPTLSSRLTSFTIAPEWRVPRRIATGQILPYLHASAHTPSEHDFLADNNYRLFDAHGHELRGADVDWSAVTAQNFPYTIRQSPGCGNLLGNVIFPFANPYGVYLNDGPDPQRFEQAYRALGRSCLQLQHPVQLATYLLGPDAARANLPTEAQCEMEPRPRHFFLKRPVALHVRYATCAVVGGRLRFYEDVYGQDKRLNQQLYGSGITRAF
ncbi:L,D-transpeptidase catalytic domain [Hymenobacter arizonensis]|uniref:L,D-transpeptidase catalytic domain n=2 Tax=Hymenobacter arizonensis TaxID=1227077 RepID=A0A1I5U495_HYMAR|nr:L,D-transpeptidase catalytic domain [Hymenobacter arizonensis]